MNRKHVLISLSGVALLFLVLLFVYQGNKTKKGFFKNGGFARSYISQPYQIASTKQPFLGFIRFGGRHKNNMYVFQKASNNAIVVDMGADSLKFTRLNTGFFTNSNQVEYHLSNDTIYGFDNRTFYCRRYSLDNKLIDSINFNDYALSPEVLPDGRFIYKSLIPGKTNFGLYVAGAQQKTLSNTNLFKGGISLSDDGIIQPYDKGFIYVCMYRNEIRDLDSALRPRKIYHTIDTAKSSPGVVQLSDGRTTYQSQPTFVNRATFYKNGKLYVCSGIFADNDRGVSSFDTLILDMYDTRDQFRYTGSLKFSLPEGIKSIPSAFDFSERGMIILFLDGHMVKYKFT